MCQKREKAEDIVCFHLFWERLCIRDINKGACSTCMMFKATGQDKATPGGSEKKGNARKKRRGNSRIKS